MPGNTPYPNYVLENKFEDQINSRLDLMRFCTVDDSLTETAGMKKKIRIYRATENKTETLAKGEGNTDAITADYYEKEYTVEMLQNKFEWFDEDAMEDPLVVDKGLQEQADDMYNTSNAKAMAEFKKAENKVYVNAFDFNAFVDAVAELDDLDISETTEVEELQLFALVHKKDVASIRKALAEQLKYVEAYARRGYIGSVNGVNLYTSAIATEGEITIADKMAVTFFIKKGTEVEQITKGVRSEDAANKRLNTCFLRKYGIFALTHQGHIVTLIKGTEPVAEEVQG